MSSTPDTNQDSEAAPPEARPDASVGEQPDKEEWELRRDEHKSSGDAAFRARDFPAAVREYTSALTLDPTHHVLLSNRSAAYLSNGEKSRSLADARECVKAAPPEFAAKARTRLGAAVLSLGRINEAREAYREAKKLDPGNKAAETGLNDVKKMEERRMGEERREALMAKTIGEDRKRKEEEKMKAEEEAKKKEMAKKVDVERKRKEEDSGGGGGGGGEGDDLLDDFFADVESATVKKEPPKPPVAAESDKDPAATKSDGSNDSPLPAAENKIQLQLSDLGSSSSQLTRLMAPNHELRNLNPFQVLLVPHTSPDDVISRRYKALSLLLHPDKCPDPLAGEAFEYVRVAMKQLGDEDKRRHCAALVENGMKAGRKDFEAAAGGGGDLGDAKTTLEDAQTKAVMKIFAEIEMRRRDVERRKLAQEKRERDQEDEEVKKEKSHRDFDKKWREEGRVEKRIGNWRDFQGGSGTQEQSEKKKKSRWN